MVYVAEGRTKEDIEKTMKKLEEEKKEAIEARIAKKRARHEAEVKKLEEQVLKDDLSRALFKEPEPKIELTKETLTLRELEKKRQTGIEAIQKIKGKDQVRFDYVLIFIPRHKRKITRA